MQGSKNQTYTLRVKSSSGINYEGEAILSTSTKAFSTLIQTDKPIYKPNDVVQYRILAIDYNVKPVQPKDVTIQISDGINIIQEIKNINFENGIYQSNLKISKSPPIGIWNLKVDDGSEQVV